MPTGIEFTNQGGKPRLRIADSPSAVNGTPIHIQRQLAALLLLPKPTRSGDSVGSGLPVLVKDEYFLEEATVSAASVDGDDLLLDIQTVLVGNSDESMKVSFVDRFNAVTHAWANAEGHAAGVRDLLLEHRSHVRSGSPLGVDTEHLIRDLLTELDVGLPQMSGSTQNMDPADALMMATMRVPFFRDELILLLDLLFRVGRGLTKESAVAGTMATLLTKLASMNGMSATRTPADVLRGISDLEAIGGGSASNELMLEIWDEYASDRGTLAAIALLIRQDVQLNDAPPAVPDDEELAFTEGRQLYRRHRQRERSGRAVRQKKANALHSNGTLACEVCGFEFGAYYHELGDGYIECHHNIPVSEYAAESKTLLEDLSLVCANCHRVLHRRRPWLSAEELRDYLSTPDS
ncbi:MAG: HNH endonuclease [Actinomycetota bacterium]|nr:HNH endonuclease [Actinomycetota bacterium]